MDRATMKAVAVVVKHVEELGLDASQAVELIREIVRNKYKDECTCEVSKEEQEARDRDSLNENTPDLSYLEDL